MRILLFIDSLGAGGAQRQFVGLARMLREKGHEVNVVVYHDIPFYASVLEENQISCTVIGKGKPKALRLYYFYQFVRRMKPDWIISYLESPSLIACITKSLQKDVKLMVSERNTSQSMSLSTRVRFNLFRLADYVIPNSFSQQAFINKHAAYLAKKTVPITNFVDMDMFHPLPAKRKRRVIQEIVVAASIWPPKNTKNFVKAVELLSKRNQHFHVSWYGKSYGYLAYFDECEQMIKEKGLEQYISLKEKTQAIREIYQHADLFCLPSYYEGTPNVIGEAVACGLPVICSNVCDNPIYVKEGINGFLFDPSLPQDIADKLSKALELSDEDYGFYSIQSRTNAIESLSKEKFINNYLNLLNHEVGS